MNPELIAAVNERRIIGRTEEEIRAELHQTGYDTLVIDEIMRVTVTDPVDLPSASQLFSDGWQFMLRYKTLALVSAVLLVVIEVSEYYLRLQDPVLDLDNQLMLSLGMVAAIVCYFLIFVTLLRIAVLDEGREVVSVTSVLHWVRTKTFGLLWVFILMVLVIMGGFILFIIPGLILSFLVYFAQYAYVKEGQRGMMALLRSHELVRGRWWTLVLRLLGVMVRLVGIYLFVAIPVGIILISLQVNVFNDPLGELILNCVGSFFSGFIGLISLRIGRDLFSALASDRLAGVVTKGKKLYIGLAVLGAIAFPILIFSATSREDGREKFEQGVPIDTETDQEAKERARELRID
jgi:hypothetical protein